MMWHAGYAPPRNLSEISALPQGEGRTTLSPSAKPAHARTCGTRNVGEVLHNLLRQLQLRAVEIGFHLIGGARSGNHARHAAPRQAPGDRDCGVRGAEL